VPYFRGQSGFVDGLVCFLLEEGVRALRGIERKQTEMGHAARYSAVWRYGNFTHTLHALGLHVANRSDPTIPVCEACHGPASEHAAKPQIKGLIIGYTKDSGTHRSPCRRKPA
jgi:hypothetical protein